METNRCYLVEGKDGTEHGYYRKRDNAEAEALRIGAEVVELDPPDRIACEDDNEVLN